MTPPTSSGSTALVTLLGWAFIVLGVIGLPISLLSGAMVITRSYGTQNADAAGLFTVVLGPAAVLVCGIGLLRHWTWAWWGALLLALLMCVFSAKDVLKKPAPSFTYISETGTETTVMSSGGGLAALVPLLISGGVLVLLLLPAVRGHFRPTKQVSPPAAAARMEPAPALDAGNGASAAIQQEILAALRGGAEFRTAHKEGGTTIRWQHGRYIREDYGDWSERAEYTDESAFLAFLWRFFEWESRGLQRAELPEPERWRNIQQLLHRSTHHAGSHGTPVPARSPLWIAGAFVIAAAAVALVVWLRGGVHWRGLHREPEPQKLDRVDSKPPEVKQPDFRVPRF
jgi:hypothetical protein